jgi:hypothetical protein
MTQLVPHSENERQRSVNDFWLCILGNLSGNWLQPFRNEILLAFRLTKNRIRLPAPS